jgi:dTDP-4-amino-4,6-dideoxygalactose transaminase
MIPFNRPYLTGGEFERIREAVDAAQLAGHGRFTRRCQEQLVRRFGSASALLTQSCTAALEMAAHLADLQPGDEVIMPSFTFVSTANAFVLRGARPVFVDIRPDTLNIDERLIEAAITPRTRAIVPVHYAGVACAMDRILAIAERHALLVIEDAAHAFGATWRGRPLGGIGHLGALSFHETKNIIAGEGGALLVNDPRFTARAEVLWEKGTDRARFQRGEVARYTWVDIGSSFLPSEITAAFLSAQLDAADAITAARRAVWDVYARAVTALPAVQAPWVPADCVHNAHMFYLQIPPGTDRDALLRLLNASGVNVVFHYVPLHSSPAGLRYGRVASSMAVTDDCSARLIRLPLWVGMDADMVDRVVAVLADAMALGPNVLNVQNLCE